MGVATAAGAEALPKPPGASKCWVKIEKSTYHQLIFGVKMAYYPKKLGCYSFDNRRGEHRTYFSKSILCGFVFRYRCCLGVHGKLIQPQAYFKINLTWGYAGVSYVISYRNTLQTIYQYYICRKGMEWYEYTNLLSMLILSGFGMQEDKRFCTGCIL